MTAVDGGAEAEFIAFQEQTSRELENGEFEQALAACRAATERWPGAFWPNHLLGRCLEGMGEAQEALVAYRTAVAENATHVEAASSRRAIDRILNAGGAPAEAGGAPAPRGQLLYLPARGEEVGEWAITPGDGPTADGPQPTPPVELMEYGEAPETHLASGREDVEAMEAALARCGFEWDSARRVLEFGCANGRMLRHLAPYADPLELWGVDIQSDKVIWAIENLSPPLHFAVTTTVPHLPFPDGHFDLVFAGSIFTHIGELHVAWLLELARITSPNGFLYLTFHDERAVKAALADESPRLARVRSQIRRSGFSDSLRSGDFGLVSWAPYGSAMLSQVKMSSTYIEQITGDFLRLVDTSPRAYSNLQTGYLFTPRRRRRAPRGARRAAK